MAVLENTSARRAEHERLMRGPARARAVCDGERHGAHGERHVTAREDAGDRRLLHRVGFVERAERSCLELAPELLREGRRHARRGQEEQTLELVRRRALDVNLDARVLAADAYDGRSLDANAA